MLYCIVLVSECNSYYDKIKKSTIDCFQANRSAKSCLMNPGRPVNLRDYLQYPQYDQRPALGQTNLIVCCCWYCCCNLNYEIK